jgi:hypothetical protein
MVVTCMWTTPSGDSFLNDHPLAHSMPGAGVVHPINRVEVSESAMKAKRTWQREGTTLCARCGTSRARTISGRVLFVSRRRPCGAYKIAAAQLMERQFLRRTAASGASSNIRHHHPTSTWPGTVDPNVKSMAETCAPPPRLLASSRRVEGRHLGTRIAELEPSLPQKQDPETDKGAHLLANRKRKADAPGRVLIRM